METRNKDTSYQFNITSMFKQIKQYLTTKLPNGLCLIALTNTELYEDKTDLFVAGMASGNQRIALFSLLRYDPNLKFSSEFWYQITALNSHNEAERKQLILERSVKLLVHETMHLLGLDHCIYYDCVMNGSGHLEEDFKQPLHLCPVCLRKMFVLCGFSVKGRYEGLREVYSELGMRKDEGWVVERLKEVADTALVDEVLE